MAGSRKRTTLGTTTLRHLRDELALPDRTPGSLGINDAGDPSRLSLLGDTSGTTGINDHGVPENLVLPGLGTFHDWTAEVRVHISADQQLGCLYPPGEREEVLGKASAFLLHGEGIKEHPYVPLHKNGTPIGNSGITIGIGYDLGQHTEKKIRRDWAELDSRPQPKPLSSLGLPLDRLARAAAPLRKLDALKYLPEVEDITIAQDLSLKVFRQFTLPETYNRANAFFSGLTKLPAGVQVALVSLVYNSGTLHKKEGKVQLPREPRPAFSSPPLSLRPVTKSHLELLKKSETEREDQDFFGSEWEKEQLRTAVLLGDLVWIYWYFESIRRVWAKDPGLVTRRNDEADLILPYVITDLRREAFQQRGWRSL